MPYATLSELPDAVKKLPKHAQEIYMSAFNSAFKQYEGDEGKAHGTAWAAVKDKYKQNKDGRWVAKEAKVAESKLSSEDIRRLLQGALEQQYPTSPSQPMPSMAWIRDVYDSELIYEQAGQSYKMSYNIDDGKVTFGTPVKVMATTVYKPIESLRKVYAEVIQEAGKRNALKDAARLRKIVELCNELLSSEAPEEDRAKEALTEATAVLALLKEQAVMKTDDGIKYPAAAYAYVPDADKPSTWKLRLWEDPQKKVTRAQLGRAAAAFSPGGFRGQKVAIPSADMAAVKRKIRAEYRKLDVEDEEIPRWVREAETRELLRSYIPLTEAKFEKGRGQVIVIKPGFNEDDSRYYSAEVLQRDYGIFEGAKMFADHPTEEEDKIRPERSIKDWVGTLSEVKCGETGIVTGIAEIIEPWLMQKLAALRDKGMLSEMGVSINAIGKASQGTIEGKETLVIEKLVACRSVDFVTEPGAGGVVTFYEADRHRDVDLVDLPALKEQRPDLIKALEAEVRVVINKEVKHIMDNEEKIQELEGRIVTLTAERDDLKTKMEEAKKAEVKAEAQAIIKEAVDKAELPDVAKARLIERFKDAETTEGIEEAIKAEVDYIAKLSEAGKVKGLGDSKPNPEADKKALKESFKKLHPEWTDAQIETAVEGR